MLKKTQIYREEKKKQQEEKRMKLEIMLRDNPELYLEELKEKREKLKKKIKKIKLFQEDSKLRR